MLRINKVNISQEKLNSGFDGLFAQCDTVDFRLQLDLYAHADSEMLELYSDQAGHFKAWATAAENEYHRVLQEIGSGVMNHSDVHDLAEHSIRSGGIHFNRDNFEAINSLDWNTVYLSPQAFHSILSTVIHLGAVAEDGTIDQHLISHRRDQAFRSLEQFLNGKGIYLDHDGRVGEGYQPLVISAPAQMFVEFFELTADEVSIRHVIERTGWADARIHNA